MVLSAPAKQPSDAESNAGPQSIVQLASNLTVLYAAAVRHPDNIEYIDATFTVWINIQ